MDVETKAGWIYAVRQLATGLDTVKVTSDSITDATAVGKSVLTATTADAARTAIGAGTSDLVVGTTASTAKAGDYTPTTSEVSNSLKVKVEIAALTPIADPATATAAAVATLLNEVIAALKA